MHFSADSGPFARRRIEHVERALREAGVDCMGHPGLHAVDDLDELRTQGGKPYTVFSPFHRTWLGSSRRAVLGRPRSLGPLPAGVRKGAAAVARGAGPRAGGGGAAAGRGDAGARACRRFLRAAGVATTRTTTTPSAATAPRGSRPTCTSAASRRARSSSGSRAARVRTAFRRQLCWRDFYHQVLLHHPAQRARGVPGALPRGDRAGAADEPDFEAWCEGRTGFPLVDAGMRQLLREGWMHNRARLVVGSFLTKDLGIDWRRGERWFMRLLIDGDEAYNNGNWQWIASVGVDPQPFFRRIYNPARHMERFDPRRRGTCGTTCPSCGTCPASTCVSRGRCPRRSSASPAA